MEELTLEIPSGRIAAVAHGEPGAPVVLCVHGLSANARSWDEIATDLAESGRRVVAVDLRGRGHSDITPPGSYGLAGHAADVLAIADAVGAEVFDYAGWSMGALIGILAASTGAGRLRRLVLIDHSGRADEGALAAVRAGLKRLQHEVVDDPGEYLRARRDGGFIEQWMDQWDAMYRREIERCADGRWRARTSGQACLEDFDDGLPRDWQQAWRALAMPSLLVRALRPINGGLIVPADQRDALAAVARDLTVAEVDANHFDVMTHDETKSAVRRHLEAGYSAA